MSRQALLVQCITRLVAGRLVAPRADWLPN